MLLQGWVRKGISKICRLDDETHSLQTVHYKDSQIHAGRAFVCTQKTGVNDFDIASPMTFYIVTPAASVATYHLTVGGSCNDAGYIELFEDDGTATHFAITGGSDYTPKNRSRSSSVTSGLTTCKTGVTVGYATSDCLLSVNVLGWSGCVDNFAMVLAPSTEYLIRATSYVENNEGSLQINLFKNDEDLNASG